MRVITTDQAEGRGRNAHAWAFASLFGDLRVAGGDGVEEVWLTSKLCEQDGFLYLEVPDDIVDGFFKLIPGRGISKPEEASSDKEYVGAHISVMYADETKKIKKKIREIGEEFDYTLDKMFVTEPETWDAVKEVYFISVKSPQLEALRKRYGLSKKLNGHDFHITVAVRMRK